MALKYCPNCFELIEESEEVCPHCENDFQKENAKSGLPKLSSIKNQYILGNLQDTSGEDVQQYIGLQISSKKKVIISEFFPKDIVFRNTSERLDIQIYAGQKEKYLNQLNNCVETWKNERKLSNVIIDICFCFGTCYLIREIERATLEDSRNKDSGNLSVAEGVEHEAKFSQDSNSSKEVMQKQVKKSKERKSKRDSKKDSKKAKKQVMYTLILLFLFGGGVFFWKIDRSDDSAAKPHLSQNAEKKLGEKLASPTPTTSKNNSHSPIPTTAASMPTPSTSATYMPTMAPSKSKNDKSQITEREKKAKRSPRPSKPIATPKPVVTPAPTKTPKPAKKKKNEISDKDLEKFYKLSDDEVE